MELSRAEGQASIGTFGRDWTRFAQRDTSFAQRLAMLLEEQMSLLHDARLRR